MSVSPSAIARLGAILFVSVLFLVGPRTASAMGPQLQRLFLADEFELGLSDEIGSLAWDTTAWIGGDWNRVWLKTEGEVPTRELALEGEAQLLYSRLIAPFWEFQVGVRADLIAAADVRDSRGHLVVGLDGLAPYWFEIEPAFFVSHQGDVSARLRISHSIFVTQRLIAEPSFETNVAVQAVPEFGVGAGLNDIQLGLRLRFEIAREFAPYLGVSWRQTFGETADLIEASGESAGSVEGVAGARFWF